MSEDESTALADPDALRPLEAGEIRARRRLRAIVLVWAWELAAAFVLAAPVHRWARRMWGTHPDGDAVFFRPGGHALLSWLDDDNPALSIVLQTTILLFVVFAIVGQLVTGALVAALATGRGTGGRSPSLGFALRAGGAAFVHLLAISALAAGAEGLLVGCGVTLGFTLEPGFSTRWGDAIGFELQLLVLAPFVLVALRLGVVLDLVRVAIVRDVVRSRTGASEPSPASFGTRLRDALLLGWRSARGGTATTSLAWAWRAALALALAGAGLAASNTIGAGGGATLAALFVIHQLIVLGRAGLRASWLANALRFVVVRAVSGPAKDERYLSDL